MMKKISLFSVAFLLCMLVMPFRAAADDYYLRGDSDGDGKVNINDVTTLIDYLLKGVWPDEPTGETAAEKMTGHWVVTVDAYDEAGNLLYEDPYGLGEWEMCTYRTDNDDADQMWLSDEGNFWGYNLKVFINLDAMTFGIQNGFTYNDGMDDQFCTITNGRIIENGGLNVNGEPTDAIEYDITFTDDPYGFVYHVHGVRNTEL